MNRIRFAAAALAALSSAAAFGEVAAGYPDWTGMSEKTHVYGRMLSPSDLRHKITVVIEIDPSDAESAKKQIEAVLPFCALDSLSAISHAVVWERFKMPRGVTVAFSCMNAKDGPEAIQAFIKDKNNAKALEVFKRLQMPIYSGLTFPGAPDGTGKRPFAYLMGPDGTTPLASGSADAKTLAQFKKTAAEAKKKLPAWRQYYGPVAELQHFKSLEKAFDPAKPKPLAPEVAKLRKGIASKDPEVAKEAQQLFDALEQTKSDLMTRIALEAWSCPHRAAYDAQELLKYWPGEKKHIAKYAEKIKSIPEAGVMAKMFSQVMTWSDPEFTCKNAGEAKKIVAELNKMKKTLEKYQESKVVSVQNGAAFLMGEIDELIEVVPMRVPEK